MKRLRMRFSDAASSRDGRQIGLASTHSRQPQRTFTLNQCDQSFAQQGGAILNTGQGNRGLSPWNQMMLTPMALRMQKARPDPILFG